MKLLILDRDGVINEDSDAYIKTVEEWIVLPGSAEAIARFCKAGYTVAVATNQSGIGRGYFSQATLDAMHEKMHSLVNDAGGKITTIAYCPHTPDDGCDCRKPLTGLVTQIVNTLNTTVTNALFVGDSFRDLECAVDSDCKPVLVRTGKGIKTVDDDRLKEPRFCSLQTYDDLAAFADATL